MAIIKNSFKKLASGLSVLAAKLPDKSTLYKSSKAAGLLCSIVVAGKLGHTLIKRVSEKVETSISKGKEEALEEIREKINKELEKFIFECIFRWLIYISLIMLAYITTRVFNLRKDVLVAIAILGIYSFYLIKAVRIFRWYISFSKENSFTINPIRLMRAYLEKAILDRWQMIQNGLSLPERLALNFFGPTNDKLVRDIANSSLQSVELRREAITRIGMCIIGLIIYTLIYEKLFLLVTGIDFNSIWEPFIWPFRMLITIFSI